MYFLFCFASLFIGFGRSMKCLQSNISACNYNSTIATFNSTIACKLQFQICSLPILTKSKLVVWTLLTISHLKIDFSRSSHLNHAAASLACYSSRPTKVEHNFSLSMVTTFVNMSAGFLLPRIFLNVSTSSSSRDLMK